MNIEVRGVYKVTTILFKFSVRVELIEGFKDHLATTLQEKQIYDPGAPG